VKKIASVKKPQNFDAQADNTRIENPSTVSRKRPAAALDGNNTAIEKSKRRKLVEEPKAAADASRSKALLDLISVKAHEDDEVEHNVVPNVVVNKKRGRPAKPKTATAATRRGRTTVTRQQPPDTAQETVHIPSGQSEAAGQTPEAVVDTPDIRDADSSIEPRNAITIAAIQTSGNERVPKSLKPKSVRKTMVEEAAKEEVEEAAKEEVEEDTPVVAPNRGRRKAEEPKEPQFQIDMEVEAPTKTSRRGRKAQKPVSEVPGDTLDAPPQRDVKAKGRARKEDSTPREPTKVKSTSSTVAAALSDSITTAIAASVAPEEKTIETINAEVTSAVPPPRRRGRPAKSTTKRKEAEVLVQDQGAVETHTRESRDTVREIKRLGRPKMAPSSDRGTLPDTAPTELEAPALHLIEQEDAVHKEIKPRRGRPKKAIIAEKPAHEGSVQDNINNTQKAEQKIEQEADVPAIFQPKRRGRPPVPGVDEQEGVSFTQTKPRRGRPTKAKIASDPAHEDAIHDRIPEMQTAEQEADISAEIKPKRRGRPAKPSSSLDKPAKTFKKLSETHEQDEPVQPAPEIVEPAKAIEEIQTAPQDPVAVPSRTKRTKRGRPAKVHVHVRADPEPAIPLQDPPAESAGAGGAETSQRLSDAFELPQALPAGKARRGRPATKDQLPAPVPIKLVPARTSLETETEGQPVRQQSRPQPLTMQSSNVSLSPRKLDEEMRRADGTKKGKGKVTLPVFRMTATRTKARGIGGGVNDWMKEDWFEPSVPASLLR